MTDINGNQDGANFLQNKDVFQRTLTDAMQTSHEIRLQNEDRVAGIFDYVVGYFNSSGTSKIHLDIETPVVLPAFLGGGVAAVAVTPINSQGANGAAEPRADQGKFVFRQHHGAC